MAESDSEETSAALPITLPRACDSCRARKIRCDKIAPCSNCRTANIKCHTSDRPAKEQRQRVLISNQYEQKIDAIEDRLSGIEQLLQRLVDNQASLSSAHPNVARVIQNGIQSRSTHQPHAHPEQFEGESSLTASSKQAHRSLESLLGQNVIVRNDPDVAAALSALQDLQRHGGGERDAPSTSHVTKDSSPQPPPPFSVVMDVIQEVKDSGASTVLAWFWYMAFNVDTFTDDCKRFYESPETASTSLQIIVYSGLYSMFIGHPLLVEHPPNKTDSAGILYRHHADQCRVNLNIALSNLPMTLSATIENITALALGSAHAIQSAEFSLCWTLTCTAARLCQSLGWHRRNVIKQQGAADAEGKKGLFWTIYFNDKCLSLRLGVSATFQDYDVALEYPKIPPIESDFHAWGRFTHLSLEIATLHGLIYEKLYSPGASTITAEQRSLAVYDLSRQIQEASRQNAEILQSPQFQHFYMKMLGESTEVLCACLLTLVYRKLPQDHSTIPNHHLSQQPLNTLCINAARSAMQSHQLAIRTLQVASKDLWLEYFHWTVLNCPFTPFMVVFSNAVATLSEADLALLEEFVTSLKGGPALGASSDAIVRFHRLCDGFYKLARSYVAASLRERGVREVRRGERDGATQLVSRKRDADAMLGSVDLVGEAANQGQSVQGVDPVLFDPGENWLLSGTFEDWLLGAGSNQSLDFLGGDWPAYGTL